MTSERFLMVMFQACIIEVFVSNLGHTIDHSWKFFLVLLGLSDKFWDITSKFAVTFLTTSNWTVTSRGKRCCVVERAFILWFLEPNSNYVFFSKSRKLLARWHCVTSHKTAFLKSTAVRSQNLASFHAIRIRTICAADEASLNVK